MSDNLINLENSLTSLSKGVGDIDPVVSSLAPVQLEDALHKEYNGYFFNKAKRGSPYPTLNDFSGLAEYFLNISLGINKAYELMRFLLSNGSRLEDMDAEQLDLNLKTFVATLNHNKVSPKENKELIGSIFASFSSGSHHIIEDSQRYKGGKDIVFSGIPGSQQLVKSGANFIVPSASRIVELIPENNKAMYEQAKLGDYSTPLSLSVLKAAKAIAKFLFGSEFSKSKAHVRQVTKFDFSRDFSKIEDILRDFLGIKFELNLFEKPDNAWMKKFTPILSLVLVKDSPKALTPQWKNYITKRDTEENISAPTNDNYSEEAVLCLPQISVTFAVNLKPEFVNYICQSEEGKNSTYAIHTWVQSWSKLLLRPKGGARGGFRMKDVPKYVVPAEQVSKLADRRKEQGYTVDEGRVDDARITIAPSGGLMFMPKSTEFDGKNAAEYEQAMNATLEQQFQHGITSTQNLTLTPEQIVQAGSGLIEHEIRKAKEGLQKYNGTLLNFSWDYNTVTSVSGRNPDIQLTTDMLGSTKPRPLDIADYLGFNFAEEGERAIQKDFGDSLALMMLHVNIPQQEGEFIQPSSIRRGSHPDAPNSGPESGLLSFPPFANLFRTYNYLATRGHVPSFVDLVKQAAEEMEINSIEGNEIEEGLYASIIDNQLEVKDLALERSGDNVRAALYFAMRDSSGGTGSNLRKAVLNEVGLDAFEVEIKDHPRYFNRQHSSLADFGNVYTYLGGMIFKLACQAVGNVPASAITAYSKVGADGKDVDIAFEDMTLPSFQIISTDVMPFAAVFGNYVPNALDIMEQAEIQADTYKNDSSISASDIKMPGLAEGAMVFPHQLSIHGTLRNRPREATLDVAPGGGKTITLLLDIGCVVHEDPETIRPLVICPDHLVPNWCEDMTKVAKGSWNVVPLTTGIWNRWGAEKLGELVEKAPPNTIYVAGLNFMKLKPFSIAFGTRSVTQFGTTEFLKKYNFDYICLDESHKCKNLRSAMHRAVKTITTSNGIRYIRLATGTLVHKDVSDVVGQSALMSANTFKTMNVFNYEFDSRAPDSPARVRSKLSNYGAVMTKKKKEWAFMLPNPIDILVEVDMIDSDADNMGSMLHFQTYQAILNTMLEDLEEQIKKSKTSIESEEAEGSEELGIEDESDLTAVNQTALRAYLQRLEQLVIDPWGDETCEAALKQAGITEFVSEKIKAVIGRIDNHFITLDRNSAEAQDQAHATVFWEKGMPVKELDLVVDKDTGIMYMARKFSDSHKRQDYDTPSDIPPAQDKKRWKVEERGKILVFCRYSRSVDSIFKNLPAKYAQVARPFHGGIKNKWQNLDDFKNDPNVKILVANEQSIVEGQNLQMASRIIRVDSPWTPGDYDQSTARIFRPDPAAAKIDEDGNPGEMKREVIFIDWVMTRGTSEVAKVARLMWRTVEKVKFDEKGNKRYDPLMETDLPPLSMSLETLRTAADVEDLLDYFQAKSDLNAIEGAEFSEMRKTTQATMIPLEPMAPREDFAILEEVPFANNQNISDPKGFGLERFLDYIQEENLDQIKDKDSLIEKLIGLPVKTEFGTGTLLRANVRYAEERDEEGNRVVAKEPVSSVKVRLNGSEELIDVDPKVLYIATKVTDNQLEEFFKVKSTWTTETDRKKAEKIIKAQEEQEAKAAKAKAKRKAREEAKVAAEQSKERKRTKRKENIRKGKPVNEGVKVISDKAKATNPKKDSTTIVTPSDAGKTDMRLRIIPSVYDGFIAVHANLRDPDSHSMKEFGFKEFGEYIYIEAKFIDPLYSIFEWIETMSKKMKVDIDRASEKRLEAVQDAFEDIKRMGFNAKLAAKVQSDLPTFYRTRHREAQNKRTIKIYPMVMEDRVRLAIDLGTSPKARRWIDKVVPGARGAKWKYHEGMRIFMAATKTDAKRKIKEVVKEGYQVTNLEKALEQISSLRLVRSKKK